MILLSMMLIPMVVALGFFLFGGKKVTFFEFLGQNVAQLVVMSLFLAAIGYRNTHDVEVWNGRVAKKERNKVSCGHSYSCNCYQSCSGSGSSQTCTTICQTCYEHSYDVDWDVYTTNGENFEIDRINRQGTDEPPRWTAVKIGEPTSLTHGYKNYVKAAPDSLFRRQGLLDKYAKVIPAYPGKVYDYHRLDRLVLAGGASISDADEWNKALSELNADLGAAKQVNMSVVIVQNQPPEFFFALQQAWIGGKKNDVIAVIGVDDSNDIQWAEVMAWTQDKMAEVVIKDAILINDYLDRVRILSALSVGVKNHYVRKPMKDYEYLKDSVAPSMGEWIFAMVLGLAVSIGLGIFFLKNDHDQDDESNRFFNRNNNLYKRRY